MEFYIRPASGFTARMAKLAERGERVPVSIDGPYGDPLTYQKLSEKDKVVLIAGGSGSGYLLPLLESLLREPKSRVHEIRAVIAVRHRESAAWLVDAVEGIRSLQKDCGCSSIPSIEVYVTDDMPSTSATYRDNASTSTADAIEPISDDPEKDGANAKARSTSSSGPSSKGVAVIEGRGRPDLKALIKGCANGESVGVTACGPASMLLDVRNACASEQTAIIAGKTGGELWLHTEAFGW